MARTGETVKTNLRSLRMQVAARLGEPVTIQQVAEASGVSRSRLNKLELGLAREIKAGEMARLRRYFSRMFGREVDELEIVSDLLDNHQNSLASAAA